MKPTFETIIKKVHQMDALETLAQKIRCSGNLTAQERAFISDVLLRQVDLVSAEPNSPNAAPETTCLPIPSHWTVGYIRNCLNFARGN